MNAPSFENYEHDTSVNSYHKKCSKVDNDDFFFEERKSDEVFNPLKFPVKKRSLSNDDLFQDYQQVV